MGRTPLHYAAIIVCNTDEDIQKIKNRSIAKAKVLIANGANLNAKDNKGRTPLTRSGLILFPPEKEHKDMVPIVPIHKEFPEVADLLKKHGAVE